MKNSNQFLLIIYSRVASHQLVLFIRNYAPEEYSS